MAVGGTVAGEKAQQPAPVQLYGLAGRQIVGGQNEGLLSLRPAGGRPGEQVHHPAGDVSDVRRPCLQVGVLQGGKGGGEALAGGLHRILRRNALGAEGLPHRAHIVLVLQHHLVDLKNSGIPLPHRFQGPGIQLLQLLLGGALSRLKAGELLLRRQVRQAAGPGLLLVVHPYGPNGDSL